MTYKVSGVPLISADEIHKRVAALAEELRAYPCDLYVGVLTGAFVFVADLVRAVGTDPEIAFVKSSSYRNGCVSCGTVTFSGLEKLNVKGRRVLLIDDILDTGHTLKELSAHISVMGAASVRSCVLLDKPARREVAFEADYKGFTIENLFVVGYGLDVAGEHRALSDIRTVTEER